MFKVRRDCWSNLQVAIVGATFRSRSRRGAAPTGRMIVGATFRSRLWEQPSGRDSTHHPGLDPTPSSRARTHTVIPGLTRDPFSPYEQPAQPVAILSCGSEQLRCSRLSSFIPDLDVYGSSTPKSLQILRHKILLISECLGIADLAPVTGFPHHECLPPSRTSSQPCARK